MRRSIIVGIHSEPEATGTARVGASFARRLDRSLVLAGLVAEPTAPHHGDGPPSKALRRRAIQSATDLLTSIATEIGEPGARKRVALIRAVAQGPKDGLTTLLREEDADLLVIGADAGGQLAYPFAGIRSGSLLRSCPCPLMVVPTGAISPFAARSPVAPGPIICGIDWSTSADSARVLSDAIGGALGVPVLPIYVDQIGPWPEVPRGIEVEVGEPAKALARAASVHRAPLIVVGVGGRETLIPSVGLGLAATSPVPILIVPPGCRLPRFRTAADMELVRAADLVQAA